MSRAQEIVAIMSTYKHGDAWEFRHRGEASWMVIDAEPLWDWQNWEYRKKPMPTLIPFTRENFPKDGMFRFKQNPQSAWYKLHTLLENGVYLGMNATHWSFLELLTQFEYTTPHSKVWFDCGTMSEAPRV